MAARRRQPYHCSYADYFGVEMMLGATRHEFVDGGIFPIMPASAEHEALAAEVLRVLGDAVASGPWVVFPSNLRIYVEAKGHALFPDGSVICGPIDEYGHEPVTAALNPVVLLEVTSDGSEEYDAGAKLETYRAIPSARDYVIVSHRERRITVHHLGPAGEWVVRSAAAGERVSVESVRCDLVVDEIYRAAPQIPAIAVGAPKRGYTYADYVRLEMTSPTKHEFFDGEIFARVA